MDMAGLASLLPMPMGSKQIPSRKFQAETVSETLMRDLPQIDDDLYQ
jgi:hypothetical protein